MDIGTAWSELARRHADRIAIIDDRASWTYRQFHARICRVGNALLALGLERGDRVALLMPDLREHLEADYAVMSAGLVRVPLDPRATRSDLVALLRHAGASALVTHASFADRFERLGDEVESLRHVIATGGGPGALDLEDLSARASDELRPPGDGEALATLNFSGGTTGLPKAAMLRHRNLLAVARNVIAGFEISPVARFLNVRPLWPIAQVILMSHLFAGATVILRRLDPERLAPLVAESNATRTSLVPTQLVRCLEHLRAGDPRLAALEAIYVGGSRIPPDAFVHALDLLGPRIGVLYGLTEAPVTTYLPPRALADAGTRTSRLASVGKVLPEYQVQIGESDAAPGAGVGEVLIRGGNVMAGYWRDDAATAAALRDGWLHTGDIGEHDADGNLSIVGRIKEVIRTGSSTVIPKEVEDVIASHPAVAEVAVIGLPDPEWGEVVTAFVVTKPGTAVDAQTLIEYCRVRLASYKKPRAVRFVASLPRSHYGKVLRAQLIAQVEAPTPP
ncbi:MAG: AMP-binding protein [Hyphomicrobiales bacterium]|nr:AMP-binding protein [Hyphomicrobiales bacterium]